ncbi:MAG: hypothetical protein RugAbin2_00104 [Rugosibacter sp.]|nr:hypothetical protein [Rugosibacter sp.]
MALNATREDENVRKHKRPPPHTPPQGGASNRLAALDSTRGSFSVVSR